MEDRSLGQVDAKDVDPGVAQAFELMRGRRLGIDPDDRRGPKPQPSGGEGGIRDATAEPPPAGIVGCHVTAGRTDVHDLDPWRWQGLLRVSRLAPAPRPARRAVRRILPHPNSTDEAPVFFYELHEGDDEVYSDAIVVSELEWEPQEFFELVQRIRHDVQDAYEQDTLIEAIAAVLERDYGFIFVSDDRLTAAINVSKQEDENFVAEFDEDDDDDDDDEEPRTRADYRSVLAEFDPDRGLPN